MNDPEPTEECGACPSGLSYATEDQLRGVIDRHHALLAALRAEIGRLRAGWGLALELREHFDHVPPCDFCIDTRERFDLNGEPRAKSALKEAGP